MNDGALCSFRLVNKLAITFGSGDVCDGFTVAPSLFVFAYNLGNSLA